MHQSPDSDQSSQNNLATTHITVGSSGSPSIPYSLIALVHTWNSNSCELGLTFLIPQASVTSLQDFENTQNKYFSGPWSGPCFSIFFLRFYCAISVKNEFMNWLESNPMCTYLTFVLWRAFLACLACLASASSQCMSGEYVLLRRWWFWCMLCYIYMESDPKPKESWHCH